MPELSLNLLLGCASMCFLKIPTKCFRFINTYVAAAAAKSLLATPWTAAYQAPLSMGFSRQEYWSGVPLPSPTNMYRIRKIRAQILYIKQDHYNESILLTPWSQPSLTLLNLGLLSPNPSFSLFRYTGILELCLFVSLHHHINKWYHSIRIIFQLALYLSTYV